MSIYINSQCYNVFMSLDGLKDGGETNFLTLQKAIELGEYQPEFLSKYPEFQKLSKHAQFQLIRQAIDNRERQLISHWAEINNVLDFSKKPELQEPLKNLEMQRKLLMADKERLYMEFAQSETT